MSIIEGILNGRVEKHTAAYKALIESIENDMKGIMMDIRTRTEANAVLLTDAESTEVDEWCSLPVGWIVGKHDFYDEFSIYMLLINDEEQLMAMGRKYGDSGPEYKFEWSQLSVDAQLQIMSLVIDREYKRESKEVGA